MLRCNGVLRMLQQIAARVGADVAYDPDTQVLGQATKPERLAEQIEQTVTNNSTEPGATKVRS